MSAVHVLRQMSSSQGEGAKRAASEVYAACTVSQSVISVVCDVEAVISLGLEHPRICVILKPGCLTVTAFALYVAENR